VVLVEDLREKLDNNYVDATQIKDESVAAGILQDWNDQDEGRHYHINWLEVDRR